MKTNQFTTMKLDLRLIMRELWSDITLVLYSVIECGDRHIEYTHAAEVNFHSFYNKIFSVIYIPYTRNISSEIKQKFLLNVKNLQMKITQHNVYQNYNLLFLPNSAFYCRNFEMRIFSTFRKAHIVTSISLETRGLCNHGIFS